MVDFLQEVWYQNVTTDPVSHPYCKQLINSRKLWVTHKDIAGTKFLLCDRILGTIGALVIDYTFKYESIMLPIDDLINDLTRVESDDNKFGPEENE